jgi:hypothetical protein
MSDTAWEIEHSLETAASPAFAWGYMTNVENYDDPPATFKLEGPFANGSSGTTEMPGQEPRHWQLRDVNPGQGYTVECPLERATLSFLWRFDALPAGRTRLTQRIVLRGENAGAFLADLQLAFGSNLAPGMARIAAAMERAEAKANDARQTGPARDNAV